MANPSRRSFGPKVSGIIFDNASSRCFYCGKQVSWAAYSKGDRGAWHVDHLKPYANGGMTTIKNGRVACVACNTKKSDMSVNQFTKKYGGTSKISKFVRCHGFLKNMQPCKSKALQGKLYCKRHSKNLATAPAKKPRATAKKATKKPKKTPTVKKTTNTKKPKNRTAIKKSAPKKSTLKKSRTGKK